jgi:hypothetical protein
MTRPQAPVPRADDSWDVDPEHDATKVAPPPSPPPPAVTPVMPPVVAPVTPAQSTISAVDLRLIVREMIDQAIAPLQMRLAELERRPMAASSPAFVMQAAPAPAAVAPARPVGAPLAPALVSPAPSPVVAAAHAAPTPYASAMAAPVAQAPLASGAPAASAPRSLIVAPPPLLDVKAIEMDRSIDVDVRGFDGGRRKRRMILLFFFAVLILFGGMFALLADSYTPHH